MVCTLISSEIAVDTVKTANLTSASVVSIGDLITYSLTTTITGGNSNEALVLSDTLSNGLTLNSSSLPSNFTQTGQVITCTYPVGASAGTHAIAYTATVNSTALNRKPNAGVDNSVKAGKGSCSSCVTTHGLVSMDTSKKVELPTQPGTEHNVASIGDSLTFTISTSVTGGAIS